MAVLTMVVTATLIILLVRYGLVVGIDHLAGALGWSPKTRGQATGFATSVPELVCLVAAALAGVWDVGLWNIAASNLINLGLMLAAAARYRQLRTLLDRRFRDEVAFALLAVVVPLGLMQAEMDTHWAVVPILLSFFVGYRLLDVRLNRGAHEHPPSAEEQVGSLPFGLILGVTALALIAVTGFFLGDSAEQVVNQLGMPAALAGWILGVVTSLPEMVTFFAVYATAQRAGRLGGLEDTQEVLDNLTSSNMANVGLIYPTGLAIYLIGAALAPHLGG